VKLCFGYRFRFLCFEEYLSNETGKRERECVAVLEVMEGELERASHVELDNCVCATSW
jgi:hypothetical protein